VLGGANGTGQPVPFGIWPDWWAGAVQFVGGYLVLLGLGTRFFAVLCSGSMAFAYFVVHQPMGLLPMSNGGEMAALFAWSFLMIAAIGGGRFSADRLIRRKPAEKPIPLTDLGSPTGAGSDAQDKELAKTA
jgi:putative oxidoreductase